MCVAVQDLDVSRRSAQPVLLRRECRVRRQRQAALFQRLQQERPHLAAKHLHQHLPRQQAVLLRFVPGALAVQSAGGDHHVQVRVDQRGLKVLLIELFE